MANRFSFTRRGLLAGLVAVHARCADTALAEVWSLPCWRATRRVLSLWSWCSSLATAASTAANWSAAVTLARTTCPGPLMVTSQISRSSMRGLCSALKWTSARSMSSR